MPSAVRRARGSRLTAIRSCRDARSAQLGTAARRVLEREHHPAALADRTLELLARPQIEGCLRERPSV